MEEIAMDNSDGARRSDTAYLAPSLTVVGSVYDVTAGARFCFRSTDFAFPGVPVGIGCPTS
jgi:hypothetical protein